jgi:membrane fusion protein, multidrug efflux system
MVIAARMSAHFGSIQLATVKRPAVQSGSSSPGSLMASDVAIHEGPARRLAEVDARVDRTLDRPPELDRAVRPKVPLRERVRRPLLILFPVILAVFGTAYYLAEEPYVSTDDAFVRAAKESVNARVAGQVVQIAVVDNQHVKLGQLLFQIDPQPYQIAVDQAAARLDSTRLQINELKATYRQQVAELRSASASADFDQREYARRKALVTDGWTPREVYDQAETTLRVAYQRIASDAQQIANTVAALDGDPNIEVDRHPSVRAAQAQLDQARLDLSYATVVAPDDGIVTRVDDLQVGDFVNPGAAVFSMMSSRRIWIEANFRETGLTHMRPGQEAVISVDAYPDRTFMVHVVSMSPGTGSDFAVLPPENATGNWVKVVQRLPIRLEFDRINPDQPLFSGLSVTVRVDTDCRRTWLHPLQPVCATAAAQ